MFNFVSKQPYSGKNAITLECAALDRGFTSDCWLTFRQAKELGLTVRGEHGEQIHRPVLKTITDKVTGELKKVKVMKVYTVFNMDQTSTIETQEAA